MVLAIIGAIILLAILLITIRLSLSKSIKANGEETQEPLIHASGIYSIMRQSPRDEIARIKPSEKELRKYCSGLNENMDNVVEGQCIDQTIQQWNTSVDKNVTTIEDGDKEGIEFYYYEFDPIDCEICKKHLKKGQFVTRQEIYKHPAIIPPFHLGCTTTLLAHHGKEDLRDTTELGMRPFFNKGIPPVLPDWKTIPKQPTFRGSK